MRLVGPLSIGGSPFVLPDLEVEKWFRPVRRGDKTMDATQAQTNDTLAHQEQGMATIIAGQYDEFRRNIALPGGADVPEGRVVITRRVEDQGQSTHNRPRLSSPAGKRHGFLSTPAFAAGVFPIRKWRTKMKHTKHGEPRDRAASEMADAAASHFVPLGQVTESIVRQKRPG